MVGLYICNKRKEAYMATASFSKQFVFDNTAKKKYLEAKSMPGVKASAFVSQKIAEGKKTLASFSPRSKK